MNSFRQSKIAKLTKYRYRLKKALSSNNLSKVDEYFQHFKYHAMTGGTETNEEVIKILNNIINATKNLNNDFVNQLKIISNFNNTLISMNVENTSENKTIIDSITDNINLFITTVSEQQKIQPINDSVNELIDFLNKQIENLSSSEQVVQSFNPLEIALQNITNMIEKINIIKSSNGEKNFIELSDKIKENESTIKNLEEERNNLNSVQNENDDKFKIELESVKAENTNNITNLQKDNDKLIEKMNNMSTEEGKNNDLINKINNGLNNILLALGLDNN